MKLRKGDTVKVTAGKDRGKQGKITQVFPKWNKLVVDGVNTRIKHLKARREREKGQRLEFFAPLAASNVQLLCPKCQKITRIGMKIGAGKKKERFCKKCKELI